ncbi:MAG: 50S ribosomal protein L17 [bacterium]|nr:50S ribosomal protein L17 [bacterium]
MRHLKKGRKFGRTKDQREAMLKILASQLILHGRIITGEAKAKELRPLVEKMVTRAKEHSLASRRDLARKLPASAVAKLVKSVGPSMTSRPGGYTRIIRLAPRKSDSARMAIIEFVQQ